MTTLKLCTVTLKNGISYMICGTHYIHTCNDYGFEFVNFYINHILVHSVNFSNVEEIEEFDQRDYTSKSLIEY